MFLVPPDSLDKAPDAQIAAGAFLLAASRFESWRIELKLKILMITDYDL